MAVKHVGYKGTKAKPVASPCGRCGEDVGSLSALLRLFESETLLAEVKMCNACMAKCHEYCDPEGLKRAAAELKDSQKRAMAERKTKEADMIKRRKEKVSADSAAIAAAVKEILADAKGKKG